MNCRLPPQARLTRRQQEAVGAYTKQQVQNDTQAIIRRYFKLMCYALNREFGFGAGRCAKVLACISALAAEHERDEIFWRHIDQAVIGEMGIEFDKDVDE